MNDPIISPWIFYIGYLSKMSFMLVIIAIGVTIFLTNVVRECQLNVSSLEHEIEIQKKYIDDWSSDEKAMKSQSKLSNLVDKLDATKKALDYSNNMVSKSLIATIIITIMWIAVPNETTIYRMVVASYVTPHNLQVTGETIENIVDKTVDKILLLKENKK